MMPAVGSAPGVRGARVTWEAGMQGVLGEVRVAGGLCSAACRACSRSESSTSATSSSPATASLQVGAVPAPPYAYAQHRNVVVIALQGHQENNGRMEGRILGWEGHEFAYF